MRADIRQLEIHIQAMLDGQRGDREMQSQVMDQAHQAAMAEVAAKQQQPATGTQAPANQG